MPSDGSRETALESDANRLAACARCHRTGALEYSQRGSPEGVTECPAVPRCRGRRAALVPGRAGGASAGRSRQVASVTPESARRFDAVECEKIKRTYLLQLACGRRLPETVGEVVEPCLIFILEVKQSAYRILPALRSGSGGPAAVGTAPAPAVAVPCGAPDNAVVAVRWSKPWSLSTVT